MGDPTFYQLFCHVYFSSARLQLSEYLFGTCTISLLEKQAIRRMPVLLGTIIIIIIIFIILSIIKQLRAG